MAANCGVSMSTAPHLPRLAYFGRFIRLCRAYLKWSAAFVRSWPIQPIAIGVLATGVVASVAAGLLTITDADPADRFVVGTFKAETTAELRRLLEVGALDLPAIRNGEKGVPPLLLASLPADLADAPTDAERRRLFLCVMLPLILQVNKEILADRKRLQRALASPLRLASRTGSNWLTELAEKYDGDPSDLEGLLRRVDAVSPAVALAQAAQESGWGQSRFAIEGNALFGQRAWSTEAGLVPSEARDGSFAVRSFSTLLESVRAYAVNLNRHPAYEEFRRYRGEMRNAGRPLDVARVAGTLEAYSEEGHAYVEALTAVIRDNRLTDFETAEIR